MKLRKNIVRYVEGELIEFTPGQYISNFHFGIVLTVIFLALWIIWLGTFFIVEEVSNEISVFTFAFTLIEPMSVFFIYHGIVGRRSSVTITREGVTIKDTDLSIYEFSWPEFNKAYFMKHSSLSTALILSLDKSSWRRRRSAMWRACLVPKVYDERRNFVVILLFEENNEVKGILRGILPIEEEHSMINSFAD